MSCLPFPKGYHPCAAMCVSFFFSVVGLKSSSLSFMMGTAMSNKDYLLLS